jgi:hypothetical protein
MKIWYISTINIIIANILNVRERHFINNKIKNFQYIANFIKKMICYIYDHNIFKITL